MGKRELLLAVVFVVLGFAVYQFTKPPADPNSKGFSVSGLVNEIRREIRGQRASAEATDTTRHPVSAETRELRIALTSGTITITGEDRADIEAELHVQSSGYDEAEAARLVKATQLRVDQAGELVIFRVDFPRDGRQTARLNLKVPARLGVRMDDKAGTLQVSNVATVGIGSARGATTISRVRGGVTVAQRGSSITIEDVGSLRLATFSGTEARVTNVTGDTTLTLQAGEVEIAGLGAGLEVEARNTEMRFDKLAKLRGPVRINAIGGELQMTGLQTEARIDGRQTMIRIDLAEIAPIGVYNEGDEIVEMTVPKAGARIDALAVNGRVSLDDALKEAGVTITADDAGAEGATRREERASGAIFGGGPTITLRASRGDIQLRAK